MNRLALRNLFRHRVRSLVTLSAIAFSTIVLVIAAGFVQQIFVDLRDATIETGLGDIEVVRKGYFEHGVADPYAYLLPDKAPELALIEATPHVTAVATRLAFSGLMSLRDSTLSFVGLGVEPAKERIVSRNLTFLEGGDFVADGVGQVLVGQGLAANFGMHAGDRVVILGNSTTGSVNAIEATVRGIFSTQVRAFDEVAIRVPLVSARRLLKTTGAHVWVVSLDDPEHVDEVAADLKARLDPARFDVVRWIDLADVYTKTVTFMNGELGAIRVLMAMIVILGVTNMLIMNVLERTGEIGTLMALGSRRRAVVALFMTESIYLGLIGGAAGVVLSVVLAKIISAIGIPMPPPPGRTAAYLGSVLISSANLLFAFCVALVTTVLAALYPARKASRLVIVDALRVNR
jgi:putative ABC transport system permease protein